MSALLAALGGIMLGSRVGAASTDAGATLLIQAFAGAFLGATAFWPGRFNIPGTLVAVYVVGVAVTGLEQMGAALWVEPVFQGHGTTGDAKRAGRARGLMAERHGLALTARLEPPRARQDRFGSTPPFVDGRDSFVTRCQCRPNKSKRETRRGERQRLISVSAYSNFRVLSKHGGATDHAHG